MELKSENRHCYLVVVYTDSSQYLCHYFDTVNVCLVRTGVVKVVCSVVSGAVIMSVCVFTIT